MLARFLESHAFVENTKASNKRAMISFIVTALVKIDPQLRQWIEHNLDRGCPPEQLIEGMIAQRIAACRRAGDRRGEMGRHEMDSRTTLRRGANAQPLKAPEP
jgi:hypothetical protein